MAGVSGDDVAIEDAVAIAQFSVATGRVPAPSQWCDGIIDQMQADALESLF